ncbi:MAG: DUF547 domain-containing protein [Acidobacteriota bacterium]
MTLQAIVDAWPLAQPAVDEGHPRGIRWIPGVWDVTTHGVAGRQLTLNAIEHEILRVEFDEPRIHSALVCAAISCPPLRGEAFVAARLDEQLDDQTRRFLDHPDRFRVDREASKVHVSKILEWYGEDFIFSFEPDEGFTAGSSEAERAVLNFISGYLSEDDRAYLQTGDYAVEYLPYDWSLNEQ